jgi:cobalt-zinc-cadmium efflux system protein
MMTGKRGVVKLGHHHPQGHDPHSSGMFHTHAPAEKMKRAFWVTFGILWIEIAGSVFSNSLALLSDAGHVLTDLAAIGLSWYAIRQGQKPATSRMTFGYHRTGILAALTNAVTLIVIALVIGFEASRRIAHPAAVASFPMLIGAGAGLTANLWMGLAMRHSKDINVRSAVLHMLGDAVASAGVIVGAVIIHGTGWYMVDPILSVVIAAMIAAGAWVILKQTVSILMEGAPQEIDIARTVALIRGMEGVHDVHDLHIWSITAGKNILSCHIVTDGEMTIQKSQQLLRDIEETLCRIGIGHVTIQLEDRSHPHDNTMLCAMEGGLHDLTEPHVFDEEQRTVKGENTGSRRGGDSSFPKPPKGRYQLGCSDINECPGGQRHDDFDDVQVHGTDPQGDRGTCHS